MCASARPSLSSKPSTISLSLQVCDFNLSREIPAASVSHMLAHSGKTYSPLWSSPELLRGDPYGTPSDVYSFGGCAAWGGKYQSRYLDFLCIKVRLQ